MAINLEVFCEGWETRKILFRYRYRFTIVGATNRDRGYNEKTTELGSEGIRRGRKRTKRENDPSNRINPRPINPFIGPANPAMGQIEGCSRQTRTADRILRLGFRALFVMVTSKSLSSETNDRDKVDETKIVFFAPNPFF